MASVATFVQLGVVVAVVSPRVLQELRRRWWPGRRRWWSSPRPTPGGPGSPVRSRPAARHWRAQDGERPFSFWPALGLALLLTAVLLGVRWGADVFGDAGAVAVAAIAGFADSHSAGLAAASLFADGELALRTAVAAVPPAWPPTRDEGGGGVRGGGSGFGARFAGSWPWCPWWSRPVLWATRSGELRPRR
jgi:hypothetical protein